MENDMVSPQDELRGRCAYNTSLNSKQETTDDCAANGRKTAAAVACGSAPPVQKVVSCTVVDPCGPPRSCGITVAAATASTRSSTAGCCEKPTERPCDRTDVCEKFKSQCDDNGRAGMMNTYDEKPRSRYCENARACDGPYECGTPWTCDANVCTRLDDGCGGYDLTPYGQQFAICTDRVIKKCACIKFNGLQDSCDHPDCCIRRGCLDKPFPTCPPARKWRFKNVCCRDKMKKKCKPHCK